MKRKHTAFEGTIKSVSPDARFAVVAITQSGSSGDALYAVINPHTKIKNSVDNYRQILTKGLFVRGTGEPGPEAIIAEEVQVRR